MRMNIMKSVVASLAFAAAIMLAAVVVPQTTTPDAKNPKDDMKADCQAMMAKKQERQDKLKTMDATLDKLVAEMNDVSAFPKRRRIPRANLFLQADKCRVYVQERQQTTQIDRSFTIPDVF